MFPKKLLVFIACCSALSVRSIMATEAADTVISVTGQTPGVTPFLAQLSISLSDTSVLKSVQFTVPAKPGSVTRPVSITYSNSYLTDRGYLQPPGTLYLPVFGLYDNYTNHLTLTYNFLDGSSKQMSVTVTTAVFDDPCGYNDPTVLQPRTNSTDLSYDYIMLKGLCNGYSPAIIDTDGTLRWMTVTGTGIESENNIFYDNAVYYANSSKLYRIDLDGTFTLLADYAADGVTFFHHNIDRGKSGIILEANTTSYFESTIMEVDATGKLLKTWNLANIISAAMRAGGDDPSQFVYATPVDWFHNNSVAYNRADDSLIVSSRENFLICLDYETGTIKWIFGDTTKKWYQFPSLKKFAITTAPGSLAPIGQHSVSITYDQDVLVFDNGYPSSVQQPAGEGRPYSSPRRYKISLTNKEATEVWNYQADESVYSPVCGSVYEDAPLNYLIDYSFAGGYNADPAHAEITGLTRAGERIFYYQYPTVYCVKAFNSVPIHFENLAFPATGPQALNLSTRGQVSGGDNSLIAGFIVTGSTAKKVALRLLGPSLSKSGVAFPLSNPTLSVYDSSGRQIATNDDWQTDPEATELTADGLAPAESTEAATIQTLSPGAYTVVGTGRDSAAGIGLMEAYDLSPTDGSKLANISTRGFVGTGENELVSGFIVGQVDNSTLVLRALGPSLDSAVGSPLNDPVLTIYDSTGTVIASNDNWQDDPNVVDLQTLGLAPSNAKESATILHPPSGAYSAIVSGTDGSTGIALVEIFDLD